MALIKKPGCQFWLYQCSVNGRKWIRSTGCADRQKAEAKVPRLERLATLHREQPKDSLRLKNAIIKEVERIELDVSKSEAERVSCALRNFFKWSGDIDLGKLDDKMLKEYLRHRLPKASRSTLHKELCAVGRMMKENGLMVNKPQLKGGKRTKHRPFTEDEVKMFFSNCEEGHRVLFLMMLLTGARPAELMPSPRSRHIALLKQDVDQEKGIVRLRTAKLRVGQDEKVRNIRVPEKFMEDLVSHAGAIPGAFVFLPNQSLHNLFDRIIKRAGILKKDPLGRKVTAHSFRHTYATLMAERIGNNPFILKELMGHSKISTTEIYCQLQAPDLVMEMPEFTLSA